MPHKHRRTGQDASLFELPPDSRAAPLPVGKVQADGGAIKRKAEATKRKGKLADPTDDTPKAFVRLMHFNAARPDLKKIRQEQMDRDDRSQSQPGRRRTDKTQRQPATKTNESVTQPTPKIQPGETLSSFGARVDAELALGGGRTAAGKKLRFAAAKDGHLTRHAKKLRRMQAEWRKEEARRRELREQAADEADLSEQDGLALSSGRRSKRQKRRTQEDDDDDDDPWAQLVEKRAEKPVGLHDVVQAPPRFLFARKAGR